MARECAQTALCLAPRHSLIANRLDETPATKLESQLWICLEYVAPT
jgi:hypothetical protein